MQNVNEIKKLKHTKGRAIQVWGSSELVPLLLKHDLVDELWLKIHPLILGKGKKLFGDGVAAAFKPTKSVITPNGVMIVRYKRAGKVRTGNIGE